MIRLHQTFGVHAGRVIDLDREVIRFGRLPDNDVAFDPHADLDASGRHAELRREGEHWVLVDVGSRNGTLVRGQKITRHILLNGDEIEFGIGGPRVRVELTERVSSATAQATPVSGGGFPTGPATPIAAGVSPPSALPVAAGLHSQPGPPAAMPQIQHPTPPRSPFEGEPGLTPPPAGAGAPPQPTPMMPQPSLAAGTPPSEKKYGQRTVGMMIQAALQQADATRSQGGNRSTAFIRAVAQEAAKSDNRGLRIGLWIVAFLFVLTLAAVVGLFFWGRYQERELRDENVRLQQDLTELGEGETAERARLEERIQELNDQLTEQEEETGASIAERNEGAIWALVQTRNGRRSVICTAFAVRNDILATSAHCTGAVERSMGRGDTVRAVPNHGVGAPLVIRQMYRHPSYDDRLPASPDIGLVRIQGTASQHVRIGTMSELSELRAGDDVFVLGFPSVLANSGAPVAGISAGVIGRLTAFDGTAAPPIRRHLVNHSAFSDEGTAGSPIFDTAGRVVAINAGNVRVRRRVTDTNTRISRMVESDSPYAWAVRADLLLQLLAGLRP